MSLAFPLAGITAVGPEGPPFEGPRVFAPAVVELSIGDASALERNSGQSNARFTVSLSEASEQTVTVDYATADGTAIAEIDYQAREGTLTFQPGETTQMLNVQVIGDTLDEPDETFFVNLTNPVNATIADGQGLGTIIDDDGPPSPPPPPPPPLPPPPPPPPARRPPQTALIAPAARARLSAPPLLRWRAVPRARFYNVQLYRRGVKILSLWPTRARLKLRRQWTYKGRVQRLRPGLYAWAVWPAFGGGNNPRYGRILGISSFRIVSG
jgi:hypothetical protein